MCWRVSPAADMHTRARSCRESVHAGVSQSTLDSISISPWRNSKGTAVGAFDLWERANAGRMSDIDAGRVQASKELDSAVCRHDPFKICECQRSASYPVTE